MFRRKRRRIRYFYEAGPRRSRNALRRVFFIVLPIAAIIGLVFLYIYFDAKKLVSSPPVATRPVTSNYKVESNIFKTPYFELETRKSWEFQKKSSTKNKFVYVDMRHKLAQGQLTIYVNQPPESFHRQATHLLPVTMGSDGFLKPDLSIGGHCNKKAPGKDKVGEETFKFKDITFPCDNDMTMFTVLVGLKGGTTSMKLQRPDGSSATYVIHYLSSTAYPTPSDVVDVIRKFKVL